MEPHRGLHRRQVSLPLLRTQNAIKNRFFSILKNLIRKLLRKYTLDLRNIPSKTITDLYEGKGSTLCLYLEFRRFKGLLKKILKHINFEIELKAIDPLLEMHSELLEQLSSLFSPLPEKNQLSMPEPEHALKPEQSK